MVTNRRAFVLVCGLAPLRALLEAQEATLPSSATLLEQFLFESKLWPNLHHFLYVLARSRNGARDRMRIAVREAPIDLQGFDALPAAERKAWEETIAAYQIHAAP